ncbi:hypothetical protein P4C99_12955 [Pontiellaceae bacterium B1224]|nr:hypothetical protein [Pontiellaceae bacterium B1224]
MSLRDPEKVEMVTFNQLSQTYGVIGIDDGTITDEIERYELMLGKLDSFLYFLRQRNSKNKRLKPLPKTLGFVSFALQRQIMQCRPLKLLKQQGY